MPPAYSFVIKAFLRDVLHNRLSLVRKSIDIEICADAGGAVTPDEAAKSLIDFVDKFDISKTGEYWAPRGARCVFRSDL